MHRFLLPALLTVSLSAQNTPPAAQVKTPSATTSTTNPSPGAQKTVAPPPATPTRYDVLHAAYGPFRANNDLLYYHLTLRVDPVSKSIAGHNEVRFKMLADGNRIQLDLTETLQVDGITVNKAPLKYVRDAGALFIDFPETLKKDKTYTVDVAYSGAPKAKGRFGGMTFETDPAGRPWITTACEDDGSSIWWPSKDQWKDEPQEGMDLSIAVPDALTDVSNGRFVSKVDLHDGYTQWNWHVSYPINSYDVALNIAAYAHFSDTYKAPGFAPLTLDYYALPEDLEKAKAQFPQSREMLDAFEHYFGEYPFARDGYKLIQVPYAGMEHQSAVAYGNHFTNGYLNRDWTGVGISPRFDFIIIHEAGHEWFGNAITAQDRSSMWIHEGWDTYLETLFVERRYGRADAIRYTNGLIPKVRNREPILSEPWANQEPPQDMYFKGALMIATLRSWLATTGPAAQADARWFALIKEFYNHFKYQTILTADVVGWWNDHTGLNLTPFFNQYLRRTAIPALELNFDEASQTVLYKWQAEEPGFAMPIQVGDPAHWQTIVPTTTWQSMPTKLGREQFQVNTELFYVNVSKT
jgi:aminopeptidase N